MHWELQDTRYARRNEKLQNLLVRACRDGNCRARFVSSSHARIKARDAGESSSTRNGEVLDAAVVPSNEQNRVEVFFA